MESASVPGAVATGTYQTAIAYILAHTLSSLFMASLPDAYLLTFRCYGTWLHGDERGSVDRHCNVYGTPFLPPNAALKRYREQLMKHLPAHLDAARREAVEAAVHETCAFRGWHLHAVSVRTNHIHVVVAIGEKDPDAALIALKANATRLMRSLGCWTEAYSPWSEGGSTVYLWKRQDVIAAAAYVAEGQGEPLDE